MDEIERIAEERLVEAMICWWIQPDAPEWIINYVRQALRKQRGLLEYPKDLLQNRPEQDTVDYKVWEALDNALDLIHDLRGQNAKLVALQHAVPAEMMSEDKNRIDIEKTFDQTYGVTGGICPTCNNWIQSVHSFCGFCGQPIGWKKGLFDDGNNAGK